MLKRLYRSIWGTFKHRHVWSRAQAMPNGTTAVNGVEVPQGGKFKSCKRCGATSVVKTRKPAAKPV